MDYEDEALKALHDAAHGSEDFVQAAYTLAELFEDQRKDIADLRETRRVWEEANAELKAELRAENVRADVLDRQLLEARRQRQWTGELLVSIRERAKEARDYLKIGDYKTADTMLSGKWVTIETEVLAMQRRIRSEILYSDDVHPHVMVIVASQLAEEWSDEIPETRRPTQSAVANWLWKKAMTARTKALKPETAPGTL